MYYNNNNRLILAFYPNRTFTAKFKAEQFTVVGDNGYIVTIKGTTTNVTKVGNINWKSVVYKSGRLIAVGTGLSLTISEDHINWKTFTDGNYPKTTSYNSVINHPSGGVFVVGGGPEKHDIGCTWFYYGWNYNAAMFHEAFSNYNTCIWNKVVYFKRMLSVGDNGYIKVLNSIMATSGTLIKPTHENLYGVCYGNNTYIVVGNNGTVLLSEDANQWKNKQIGTANWRSVAYGNGKYVIVGSNGYFVFSEDGTNWSKQKRIGVNDLYDIIFENGRFITIGAYGQYSTSSDGENWAGIEQIKDNNGNAISSNFNGICVIP